MINHIASHRDHAADVAAMREMRSKKTESAHAAASETLEASTTDRPAHPEGHVPPGLERAAENIASKIFARADADASGTVTLEELGVLHSRHARTLASSDLFQKATVESPADVGTDTTNETAASAGAGDTGTAADTTTEIPPGPPIEVGVTEAQLTDALTKSFYARVGVIYSSPTRPAAELTPEPPADSATPSVVDLVTDESGSTRTFRAVA
jgi:hypothetical protein